MNTKHVPMTLNQPAEKEGKGHECGITKSSNMPFVTSVFLRYHCGHLHSLTFSLLVMCDCSVGCLFNTSGAILPPRWMGVLRWGVCTGGGFDWYCSAITELERVPQKLMLLLVNGDIGDLAATLNVLAICLVQTVCTVDPTTSFPCKSRRNGGYNVRSATSLRAGGCLVGCRPCCFSKDRARSHRKRRATATKFGTITHVLSS